MKSRLKCQRKEYENQRRQKRSGGGAGVRGAAALDTKGRER